MAEAYPDDKEDEELRTAFNRCRVELGNVYRLLAQEKLKAAPGCDVSSEIDTARLWYTRALEYTMSEYRYGVCRLLVPSISARGLVFSG